MLQYGGETREWLAMVLSFKHSSLSESLFNFVEVKEDKLPDHLEAKNFLLHCQQLTKPSSEMSKAERQEWVQKGSEELSAAGGHTKRIHHFQTGRVRSCEMMFLVCDD